METVGSPLLWAGFVGFVLALFNGFGVMVYLALWLLTPNEDSAIVDARDQVRENVGEMRDTAESLVQRVRGMFNA